MEVGVGLGSFAYRVSSSIWGCFYFTGVCPLVGGWWIDMFVCLVSMSSSRELERDWTHTHAHTQTHPSQLSCCENEKSTKSCFWTNQQKQTLPLINQKKSLVLCWHRPCDLNQPQQKRFPEGPTAEVPVQIHYMRANSCREGLKQIIGFGHIHLMSLLTSSALANQNTIIGTMEVKPT